MQQNYISINKALWAARTGHHVDSAFYDMADFKAGNTSLKNIEMGLLGDINGKDVLHLQCHFGQDSISLARMGANVSAVDFSEEAIEVAKRLSGEMEVPVRFICCNVYDTPAYIDKPADIVFTSYGVVGWLPDLDKWANVIAACLKPGGLLVFVEFHPVVWMFDNSFQGIAYSYFKRDAIVEMEEGTYANAGAPISMPSVTWNHSLSEVYNSLIKAGMQITHFNEYDYSPYASFANNVEVGEGMWGIPKLEGKLPMVYSLKAVKL